MLIVTGSNMPNLRKSAVLENITAGPVGYVLSLLRG